MTRRTRRGDARPRRPGSVERRARPGGRSLVVVTTLLVIAAAALAFVAVTRTRRAPRATVAAAGPIATMRPQAALDSARAHVARGRHFESLPYFRQALRFEGEPWAALHAGYGTALHNAAIETRERRGVRAAVTRNSLERAALIDEARRELERAASLVRVPRERADLLEEYGKAMLAYGLQWEAFTIYTEAERTDPAQREVTARLDEMQARLRGVMLPTSPPSP